MGQSDPLNFESEETELQLGEFIKHSDFANAPPSSFMTKGVEHVFAVDHDFANIKSQQRPEFIDAYSKA